MIRDNDIFTGKESGEDYEVGSLLGSGGFGVVHEVIRLSDSRPFVAKAPIDLGKMKVKKIDNEYRILKKLEEKGVANVARGEEIGTFSSPTGNDVPILVMQYAQGIELTKAMKNQIATDDVREVLLKIARTMTEVHKAGYIHRDLKPDNIFVDDVAGRNDITIIDFGIAAVKDDSNTFANTKSVAATPFYAPPEQAPAVGPATVSIGNDIFSLGATGYAMLVGNTDLQRDIQNQISPPYNPYNKFHSKTIEDTHLFDVIKKSTSANRRHRFGTMEDMADHLDGAPPSENFPRIIADGHSHPLIPDQSKWMLGRNEPLGSEADILINETSPGSRYISRKQAYLERKGDCAFQLFHNPSAPNETRIGIQKGEDPKSPISWIPLTDKGYPLGPRHVFICFGYADTPPGKFDEMGNPLQPGPYKVLEYFPPQDPDEVAGQATV